MLKTMNDELREYADAVVTSDMVLFLGHDLPTLFRRAADFLEITHQSLLSVQVEEDAPSEEYKLILFV